MYDENYKKLKAINSDGEVYYRNIKYEYRKITSNEGSAYDTQIGAARFIHAMVATNDYYCFYRTNAGGAAVLEIRKLGNGSTAPLTEFHIHILYFIY